MRFISYHCQQQVYPRKVRALDPDGHRLERWGRCRGHRYLGRRWRQRRLSAVTGRSSTSSCAKVTKLQCVPAIVTFLPWHVVLVLYPTNFLLKTSLSNRPEKVTIFGGTQYLYFSWFQGTFINDINHVTTVFKIGDGFKILASNNFYHFLVVF